MTVGACVFVCARVWCLRVCICGCAEGVWVYVHMYVGVFVCVCVCMSVLMTYNMQNKVHAATIGSKY